VLDIIKESSQIVYISLATSVTAICQFTVQQLPHGFIVPAMIVIDTCFVELICDKTLVQCVLLISCGHFHKT